MPIIESVHEAAGSYKVGIGLFLLRLKRRLLAQLVDEWLADGDGNTNHLLQLIELTKRDIAITAHFLDERAKLPSSGEDLKIHVSRHAALLERRLRPLLEQAGGPPEAITLAFGDSTPPGAIAGVMASVRASQLGDYLRELGDRLDQLERVLHLGSQTSLTARVRLLRRSNMHRFLDWVIWPFFFLSWRHNGATWLTTWIPTATLHYGLFSTSKNSSHGDGIVLYPTLTSIPADADDRHDLSRHLPLLRQTIGGKAAPFGLTRGLGLSGAAGVAWQDNLIKRPTAAAIPDLHFLNVSSLYVTVSEESGSSLENATGIGGLLHICAPLTHVPPYWLSPELRPRIHDHPSDEMKRAVRERLVGNWNALGGGVFVEEMRRGLQHLLAAPSERISREVSAEINARIQSQITTTHSIKGMANDLLVFAGWAHAALDAIEEGRTLEEMQHLADIARQRLHFVHTEIALIAGTSQYAHEITKKSHEGHPRHYLPAHEPERIVEGVLHLYLLLLRERLMSDRKTAQQARIVLTGEAKERHIAALAAVRQEVAALSLSDGDDWRDLLAVAVRHDACRPIFLGLSETIRNIRPIPGNQPSETPSDIELDIKHVACMEGSRLTYLLSQYQSGRSPGAVSELDSGGLPQGLKTHNSKYGRAGFCILETEMAPLHLLQRLGLQRSQPTQGSLRYHLLLRFGVDPNVRTHSDA